jgi:hypothetical protein
VARASPLALVLLLAGCVLPQLDLEGAPCDPLNLCPIPYTCVLELVDGGVPGTGSCEQRPCGPQAGLPCPLGGSCGVWVCNDNPGGSVTADQTLISCQPSPNVHPDCCCDSTACRGTSALLSQQNSPGGVAVDSQFVYWANAGDGSINRVALDGTGMTRLDTAGTPPFPARMIVDGSSLWWVTQPPKQGGGGGFLDGGLFTVSIAGGAVSPVQRGNFFIDVAAESDDIYWLADNKVSWTDGGSAPAQLGFTQFLYSTGLAANASSVVVSQRGNRNGVSVMPRNQTPVTTQLPVVLADSQDVRAVGIDDTYAYWVAEIDGGINRVIRGRLDHDGGVQTLGFGTGDAHALVVSPGAVYWTATLDGGGTWLMEAPLDGGAPACLESSGQDFNRLAQDGSSLYWTDTSAGIVWEHGK